MLYSQPAHLHLQALMLHVQICPAPQWHPWWTARPDRWMDCFTQITRLTIQVSTGLYTVTLTLWNLHHYTYTVPLTPSHLHCDIYTVTLTLCHLRRCTNAVILTRGRVYTPDLLLSLTAESTDYVHNCRNVSGVITEDEARRKFDDQSLRIGLLFASKSAVQLLANPIVGMLTNKYATFRHLMPRGWRNEFIWSCLLQQFFRWNFEQPILNVIMLADHCHWSLSA